MNLKKVLTSVIPVLAAIIIIVVIAVIVTSVSKEKPDPEVADKDSTYVTVTSPDGKLSYTLTKGELYDRLKTNYGTDVVINTIDAYLMKNNKNSDGVSFFEAVTQEEIDKALEDEIYSENAKEDLTADQQKELEESFLQSILLGGYKDLDDYKENNIRLALAKKAYASVKLTELINETDEAALEDDDLEKYFTDSEYEVEYNNTYREGYWTIFVRYTSSDKAEEALKQLNIKQGQTTKEEVTYDTWLWDDTDTELTVKEVVQAFIDLYNNQNSLYVENYPTEKEILKSGVQYTLDAEGNIVFSTTIASEDDPNQKALNRLYYEYSVLNGVNSRLYSALKNTLTATYTPAAYTDGEDEIPASIMQNAKWYTPEVQSYSSEYFFVLKIASVDAPSLESVKQEIYDKLFEADLTEDYINEVINELREEVNIVIYDNEIETNYVGTYSEHETTKKLNGNVVAEIDGLEITTEDLYKELDSRYGAATAKDLALQGMFLHSELNTFYDVDNNEVLDNEKWHEMAQKVFEAKQSFNTGYYAYYYSWTEYCELAYGVSDIEELKVYFLYSEIVTDYAEALGLRAEDSEDAEDYVFTLSEDKLAIWNETLKEMQKVVDEYYNLSYIQIVITAWNEDSSDNKDFSEWTDYQKELAEIIVDKCKEYLENEEPGTAYSTKLQTIANAFTSAPYLVAKGDVKIENGEFVADPSATPLSDEIEYVLANIPLSAAKSAGLVLTFETEASYTNTTSYVEDFLDAGKWIWNNVDHSEYASTPYVLGSFEVDGVQKDYLTTSYGYHLYVNTAITEISTYEITAEDSVWLGSKIMVKDDTGAWVESTVALDTEYILPSLDMVIAYIKDSADENITTASGISTAVSTYFTPIRTEVTGTSNSEIKAIEWLNSLEFTFETANYSLDDFKVYLTLRTDYLQDQLTYFKSEE